jgi:hypothetical protein
MHTITGPSHGSPRSRRYGLHAGLSLALLGLILTLVVGCSLTSPGGGSGQGSNDTVVPTITIPPPPVYTPSLPTKLALVTGVPAIKPHLNGIPAFTTDDMAAYVRINPLGSGTAQGSLSGSSAGKGQGIRPGGGPAIIRDEFLTEGILIGLLKASVAGTGRGADALLGFVEEQGSFNFGAATPDSPPLTFSYAFQVFDAQTGNRVMYGGLNQPAPNATPTPAPQATVTATAKPTATQGPPPAKLSVTPTQTTEFCVNMTWPNKITIKNTGGQTLTWSIGGLPSGVSAAPRNGSLSPGASVDVTLSGGPASSFTFTVSSNGGSQNVAITCQ